MMWIVFAVILALMLIGARLFVVVGVATMLCFILIAGEGLAPESLVSIINKMESLTTKNVFLAIPFFLAAGTVMTRGGMAKRLIHVARALTDWMPGGIAISAVLACIIFAAISGSSPVTLVAVGSIMYPALMEANYPRKAAIGLLTTAGSLGSLVPPSIAMLIYAISVSGSAAVDPSDLFLAGLVPAVMITLLLCVYAYWIGRNAQSVHPKFSGRALWDAIQQGAFALMLPFIVLGGIYSGTFTPTEAGAVAFVYAVVATMFIHQDMSWKQLADSFSESATLMGSLILIVVLSFGLNDFLAKIEAPERLGEWLRAANLSPMMFLLVVNVSLIFIGALMDSVSATLVFAPLLAPIALNVYGIDPIHFGVVFVVNMEIGYLMPPVATNLFVAAAIFRRPFGEVASAVFPTLGIVCASLVVVMFVPTLSKGILNLSEDKPVYESFPWDGKALAEDNEGTPSGDDATADDTPVTPTPGRMMTMEEMMRAATQKRAADAAAAETSPAAAP